MNPQSAQDVCSSPTIFVIGLAMDDEHEQGKKPQLEILMFTVCTAGSSAG